MNKAHDPLGSVDGYEDGDKDEDEETDDSSSTPSDDTDASYISSASTTNDIPLTKDSKATPQDYKEIEKELKSVLPPDMKEDASKGIILTFSELLNSLKSAKLDDKGHVIMSDMDYMRFQNSLLVNWLLTTEFKR